MIAVENPDMGGAFVFMNNWGSDQDVVLSFTEGGFEWEGTIPNATVVTWLLPSDQVVRQSAGVLYGQRTECRDDNGNWWSQLLSSDQQHDEQFQLQSNNTTLEPVPHTTHTIAANTEYQGESESLVP